MMSLPKIVVTGASGFIGSRLLAVAEGRGFEAIGLVRNNPGDCQNLVAGYDLAKSDCIPVDFSGRDVIVHCAGVLPQSKMSDREFVRLNAEGTLSLASKAAARGVRRFVFLSTIGVNGQQTKKDVPLGDPLPVNPDNPYALSKYKAEQGLLKIASETGMQVVIVRPPLVYGPGVKGKFYSMLNVLDRRIPLPLGSVHNKRSLVALDNLVDFLLLCTTHAKAANRVFLVCDEQDLSTTQLLKLLGNFLGKPARLVPVPSALLLAAATLAGKKSVALALLGNLQIDMKITAGDLAWKPVVDVAGELRRTAERFLRN